MTDYNRNPKGLGGFRSGEPAANPGGRPRGASGVQLYALARCREAIDVATRVMRQPKDGDSVRLRACEIILDRGVGRPNQAVALDIALTKPLETMSTEELQDFRARYAAVVSASPPLIEQVLDGEERAARQAELALDQGEDVLSTSE
jgi:hypothetical protein